MEARARDCAKLALQILDGLDERTVPRYADGMLAMPPIRALVDRLREHERTVAERAQNWLTKTGRGDSLEVAITGSKYPVRRAADFPRSLLHRR